MKSAAHPQAIMTTFSTTIAGTSPDRGSGSASVAVFANATASSGAVRIQSA